MKYKTAYKGCLSMAAMKGVITSAKRLKKSKVIADYEIEAKESDTVSNKWDVWLTIIYPSKVVV